MSLCSGPICVEGSTMAEAPSEDPPRERPRESAGHHGAVRDPNLSFRVPADCMEVGRVVIVEVDVEPDGPRGSDLRHPTPGGAYSSGLTPGRVTNPGPCAGGRTGCPGGATPATIAGQSNTDVPGLLYSRGREPHPERWRDRPCEASATPEAAGCQFLPADRRRDEGSSGLRRLAGHTSGGPRLFPGLPSSGSSEEDACRATCWACGAGPAEHRSRPRFVRSATSASDRSNRTTTRNACAPR